jgi:diguanylate cyclase (GGDEF)-like protein
MSTEDNHPSRSTDSLLESVVQITGQRDRDSLELSLVKTLHELIRATRIILHKLETHQGQRQLYPLVRFEREELVLESDDCDETADFAVPLDGLAGFSAVLESRQMVKLDCGCPSEGCVRFIYPVLGNNDSVVGFLEIESGRHSKVSAKLVTGFLKIYQNYLSILDDSERDTLTGLLNRKTFDNNIARITAHYRNADTHSSGKPKAPRRRKMHPGWSHWLAVIDIDFFKSVNDRFGHLYGDEVLLLLARLMEKSFRQNDKLFRFGGEEFVVVLEPATAENARAVLERFRKAVEAFHFPQVGQVTVSIGYTHIHSDDIASTTVGHADEALYYAKQHGRNQVCCYEDLIASGAIESEHYQSDIELF